MHRHISVAETTSRRGRGIGRIQVWLAIAALTLLTGLASSMTARQPSTRLLPMVSAVATQQNPIGGEAGEANQSIRVVKVYVTRYGFDPAEIHVPAGDHLLIVRNVSGEPSVSPVVRGVYAATTTVGAEKSGDLAPDPGPGPGPGLPVDVPLQLGTDSNYAALTGFRPGTVTIDDASHPEWRCTITVDQ